MTPWLRLLRVPNLFTVPGDPLAGYALAVAATGAASFDALPAALAVGASLLLYVFGLIDNDLADLKEDRRDRPDRPLPSGQISTRRAILAAFVAFAAALALAWADGSATLGVAAVLAATILLYNHLLKRVPVVGPLAMGLCRGLSVMIGASVLGKPGLLALPAALAAGLIALYIAAVTAIAAGETSGSKVGRRRNLPAMILAFFFTFIFMTVFESALPLPAWAFLALAAVSVIASGLGAIRLGGQPEPAKVQKTVGLFIRVLLPIQAGFCCLLPWPGLIIAAVLLVCWPIAAIVGRRFYAS